MARKLDDWITSYMDYTYNSEPPELYKEWVAISCIASVLQRRCSLPWGDITFYPNMYIVLVGPSGRCRKGTAMGPGYKLLTELGVKMAAESITREALIRELKQTTSTEVHADTGAVELHSSLTIYSQELTVFLGYNNTALMSDLTDWYDCRSRWTYRTKNMGTDEIIGVWVNLIGATTPELIQSTLPRDAIGGGLTSRIIFVYADQKGKIVPAPFLTKKEEQLNVNLTEDLERIGTLRGEFRITDDFLEHYVDWYTAQHTKPAITDLRLSGYNERRPTHLLKLCMILSASKGDSMIMGKDIFDKAKSLLERTERKMIYTFSGVGKADQADTLSRVMAYIATEGECTFQQLLKTFYYDADKDSLTRIVGTINAMGFCQMVHKGKDIVLRHTKNG
tara:strand:+ start:9931 stop:11109 length:1179 start_codon:yes stop_codon:yes gene_type:complete